MASPIQSIPNLIKHEILKDLSATDITHLGMVNKLWKGVVDQPITWNRVAKQLNILIEKGEDPKEKVENYYRYHHVNQSVMQLLKPNRRSEIEAKFKDDFQLNQALPEILEKEVAARKYSDCFGSLLNQITKKHPKNGNRIPCKTEIDTALFFTRLNMQLYVYLPELLKMIKESAEFPEKTHLFKQSIRDHLHSTKTSNFSFELQPILYANGDQENGEQHYNHLLMLLIDLIKLGAAYKDYVAAIFEAGFIPTDKAISYAIDVGGTDKDAEGTLLKLTLRYTEKISKYRLSELISEAHSKGHSQIGKVQQIIEEDILRREQSNLSKK